MFPTVAFTSANYSIAALRSCLPHFQRAITKYNMAEAASAVPTFKLVLVGDGGTGKVRSPDLLHMLPLVSGCAHLHSTICGAYWILIKH